MINENQKLMTIDELAKVLRCSISTAYRYVSQRKIPFIKQNHLVLFDPQDIHAWIESKKIHPSNSLPIKSYSNDK